MGVMDNLVKDYIAFCDRRQKYFDEKTELWKTEAWQHGEARSEGSEQILAKRGPDSRFIVEANTEALVSKSNSR